MSEELRIIVQDDGSGATAASVNAPSARSGGKVGAGGTAATSAGTVSALSKGSLKAVVVTALAAVGLSAPAALAVVAGFGAAAAAAVIFAKTVKSQVKALSNFSQDVALAAGQTQVARIQAQIRRAQQIGPRVADAERQRSRIESNLTDIWTQILSSILSIGAIFTPFIEIASGLAVTMAKFLESGITDVADFMVELMRPLLELIKKILRAANLIADAQDPDERDEFTDQFFAGTGVGGAPLFIPGNGP